MIKHLGGKGVAVIFALSISLLPVSLFAQTPPNIVLIIGDDQGWTDYGFMPSSRTLNTNTGPQPLNTVVQTPNIDALAAQGVVFNNAHVTASICQPSLRSMLTSAGLQPFQWQETRTALAAIPEITLPNNPPFLFPRTEAQFFRTLPRDLGSIGYKSWEGGKYWESTFETGGFTDGLAVTDGIFLIPDGWDFGRAGWDAALCGPTAPPASVCPALDPLRTFLDSLSGEPFFLWFAPQLPHVPFDAPPNFSAPFLAMGLESCATNDCGGMCNFCANEVNYLANVAWFDALVGELMDELGNRGILNDTLIIYLNDNGWGLNMQFAVGQGQGKATLYEMGYRTPLIFSWPGQIPTGVTYDDLVSSVDIAPTILDYVDRDPLPEQQGLSLRDRIEGGVPVPRTQLIGLDEGRGHFLRTDTWRYLRFAGSGTEELYQIDIDPFETTDVSGTNPALVAQFAADVDAWEAAARAPAAEVEISGRVLDAVTGDPLTGAHVRLDNGPFPLISISGEDGFFRFGPVSASTYSVGADVFTGNLSWLGTADPVSITMPAAVSGIFMSVEAEQLAAPTGPVGSQIRGKVTDNMGNPIPGVQLLVEGAQGCTVIKSQVGTQADGAYRTENLAFTTYTVTATTPPGYQDVVVSNVVVNSLVPVELDIVAPPE